jgi:3alpha(or 20beta)-hydroxysteroid dehydrogenase
LSAVLADRTVLVAGGARGMGEHVARALAAAGAAVVIGDVRDEEGARAANGLGDRSSFVHLDVTRPEDWAAAVRLAEQRTGAPISVLVHSAGIVRREPIAELSFAHYERLLAVNLTGPFLGLKAVIPAMTAAGRGSVVVLSSVDAFVAAPGYAGYCASKAGVTGLVQAAALELAPARIRVNAIAPGAIDTPMTRGSRGDRTRLDALAEQVPMRRAGVPDEVAQAALFLASDAASYITGTTLVVDGGVMAQVSVRLPV